MKKLLLLHLAFLFIVNIFAQRLNENLELIVNKYSSDSLLNGSVLIAKNDQILFQGSFGYKNFETTETNSLSTLFAIASLTKQFTSTAILLLQENNKLSINDKIGKYVELPAAMKNIQIKNLMNHTSGIPDYWQNNINNHKDSIFAFLSNNNTLEFEPGSQHRYCNSGYFLLGQIIQSVSGKRYVDFMHERIFIPLEMENSFVNDNKEYNRAIGYDEQWNRNDYLISTGDGGIISTVLDLYLWDKALYNNTILTSESKNLMFEPFTLNNGETVNYGFGWAINKENRNIVYHTGWLASFGAYNQFDNETGYFLIVLSNQIRPELMDLINDINKELYATH